VLVSDLRVFFKMTFPECKESLLFSLINLDGSALGSELGLKVKGFSLIQLSTLTSSIRFFLQAENEEQVKAYKQASLIVCGAETVSL
jgi:ABC-type molybdate transport system permease subunit